MTRTDGRIRKGQHLSPSTEFKKGQHWRPPQQFRERAWLQAEYVDKGRSTGDIGAQFGVTDSAILFWLDRHGIKRRTTAETRALKHWGCCGASNPMYGRTGALNPRYVDGSSPERQRLSAQARGREFVRAVFERDGHRCRRCSAPRQGPRSLHAHHVKPWAGHPGLRFDVDNGITLCDSCHSWVHSKANVSREFLR